MAHNCSQIPLDELRKIFGGSIYLQKARNEGQKDLFRWELNGSRAKDATDRLLPFLVAKRSQAEIVVDLYKHETGDFLELARLNKRGLWKETENPREPQPIDPTADNVAFLAGAIDGDGTLTAQYSENAMSLMVVLGNSNVRLVEWVRDRFGGGIYIHKTRSSKHRPVIHINWCGRSALRLVRGLLPFLKEKRRHAEILIELSALKRTYDPIGKDGRRIGTIRPEIAEKRAILIAELRQLNQRGLPGALASSSPLKLRPSY
jgi:hypothetical protein